MFTSECAYTCILKRENIIVCVCVCVFFFDIFRKVERSCTYPM